MATKNIVPRGDGEGGLGSSDKAWGEGYFKKLHATETLFMPLTTTANRPASAEIGATMFDTDIGALIIWDGTGWIEAGGASPTTLNLVADPPEGGTVSGGGTHDKNSDAVIEATPNPEWTFSQWEGNISGLDGGNATANPTFVSMTQSWSIRAKFLINQYTLTAQAGTGGSTTGTGDYDFGSYGTITATPYPEYDFVNWTGGSGGDIIAPNNLVTTVLVDQDKTVTANFALKTYDVTINHLLDADASGTYAPDTSGTSGTVIGESSSVNHGTSHTLTFNPNQGYQFVGWELDGASNTLQTISYDVVGATSDNATLTFEKSGVQSDNPSISIETGDTLVINNNASGQPSSFNDTFMLNDGSQSGTYSIVANDPGPQDIVITFDGSTDLATLISNGADGTGTTPYPVTINSGDGGAIGMAAQSITITGGTNVFTLNIKDSSGADVATESGGVLTLGVYDDAETYTYYSPEFPGDLGTITISDGFADSSSPSTTTTVTENRTINLRTSIQTYSSDITVADFDYQGTPEVPGTATIDNSIPTYGSSVTITATSSNSSKYEFDYWGGASASLLTDINNPSATIDPVEADIVLVANFKLVQYTLTVDSFISTPTSPTQDQLDAINNFSSILSTTGSGSFDFGSSNLAVSFSFSGDSSIYSFDGWTDAASVDDSALESTTLSSELSSNITVTANFSLATFNVSLSDEIISSNTIQYTVTGNGTSYSFSGAATGSNPTLPSTGLFDIGDTIIITNNSAPNHPIAIEDSNGNIVAIEDAGVLTHTFTLGGTYTYFCTIPGHREDGMEGTINVQGSGTFSGGGEYTYGSVVDIEYTPTPGVLNSFDGTFTLFDDTTSSNYVIEYNVFSPDPTTLYGDGISNIFVLCQAGNATVVSGPGVGGVGTYEVPKLNEPILLDGGQVQYGFVAWTGSDASELATNTATTQITSISKDISLVLDYGLPPIPKLNLGLGPFYYGESLNLSTASYDIDGAIVSETLDTGGLTQSQTGVFHSSHSLGFNFTSADIATFNSNTNYYVGSKATWPNSKIVSLNRAEFTLSMWIKGPNFSCYPVRPGYFYLGNYGGTKYYFDSYNNTLRLSAQFGGVTFQSGTFSLLPGYNSLVVTNTQDPNTREMNIRSYFNGTLIYNYVYTYSTVLTPETFTSFAYIDPLTTSIDQTFIDWLNEFEIDQIAFFDKAIPGYDIKKMFGAGTPIDVTKYYMYPLKHLLEFNDPSNKYKDSVNTDLDTYDRSSTVASFSNVPSLNPIDAADRPQQIFSLDLPLTDPGTNEEFNISVTAEDDDGLTSTASYTLNLVKFPLVGPTEEAPLVLVEEDGQTILSAPVVFSAESELNVDGNTRTYTVL